MTGFPIHRALTVVAIICIGLTAVLSSLNASRFCFREERILGDGEFLRTVARNFVELIQSSEQHWRTLLRTNDPDRNYSHAYVINYKNVDEFYDKNPNCCQIGRFDGPKEPIKAPGLFHIISGHVASIVTINYDVYFRIGDGAIETQKRGDYVWVNSCGDIKS